MTPDEFESWVRFHRVSPMDDEFRYRRPAAVLASIMSRTGKPLSFWTDYMKPALPAAPDADGKFADLSPDDLALLKLMGVRG